MKIFPSRQPFVVSEPGTSCQNCFSFLSQLCTVVITHASTCIPSDRNRCACLQLSVCVCVHLLFLCKRNVSCTPPSAVSRGRYGHRKGDVSSFGVVRSFNIIVTQEERNVFITAPPVLCLCNNTRIELNA